MMTTYEVVLYNYKLTKWTGINEAIMAASMMLGVNT